MFSEAQRFMRRQTSSEGFTADPITREKLHVRTLKYSHSAGAAPEGMSRHVGLLLSRTDFPSEATSAKTISARFERGYRARHSSTHAAARGVRR